MTLSRRILPLLAAAVALSPAPPAAAQDFADAARRFWRDAARMDVEAAYRMLRTDHPATAPEVDDPQFKATLDSAHALAARRAEAVASYDGYAATLVAFGNSFHDAHVRARPVLRPAILDWPGFLIGRTGRQWTVVNEVPGYDPALKGATLVGCDGRSADDLARERLGGFRIDPESEAQRRESAAWLLVDDHNPFLKRPVTCTFAQGERRRTVTLQWVSIALPALLARIEAVTPHGAAGFGVRRAGAGYWIAVESFLNGAMPVVEQVRAMAADLRRAPFVVLDVRGNGGGSSVFGEQIAGAILGDAHVAAQSATGGSCGDVAYRTTPANIATFRRYVHTLGPTRGPAWTRDIAAQADAMETAAAAGKPFSAPLTCPAPARKPVPAPLYHGRLYLLTDSRCFSSCLVVTELWRRLGAIQIGQETDANTHYIDVRDTPMPSGMTTFSTLMGIDAGTPLRVGPFVPAHVYPGDMGDTPAVKRWVLGVAAR